MDTDAKREQTRYVFFLWCVYEVRTSLGYNVSILYVSGLTINRSLHLGSV